MGYHLPKAARPPTLSIFRGGSPSGGGDPHFDPMGQDPLHQQQWWEYRHRGVSQDQIPGSHERGGLDVIHGLIYHVLCDSGPSSI